MTVSALGTGIYARGADGKIAMVGVGVQETYTDEHGEVHTRTVIEQIADHIKLEGLVTANQNFKILNDGSIEARNGVFDGYLRTRMKYIESSDAEEVNPRALGYNVLNRVIGYILNNDLNLRVDMPGELDGAFIVLPSSSDYIGCRVILWNGCTPPYTRADGSIRHSQVICEDDRRIMGLAGNVPDSDLLNWMDPLRILWMNGIMELVGVPVSDYDENGNPIIVCGWCITSFNAVFFSYETSKNQSI